MALPNLSGVARLTGDPELRFTSQGVACAKFNLAFNSRRKNQQTGEWEDGDVFFIGATAWRDQAEAVAEHLSKGSEVVVTGRPKTRSWEDKEGQKRSTTELMVDSVAPTLRALAKKAGRTADNATRNGQGDDPWAAQSAPTGGGFSDDPPF